MLYYIIKSIECKNFDSTKKYLSLSCLKAKFMLKTTIIFKEIVTKIIRVRIFIEQMAEWPDAVTNSRHEIFCYSLRR